MHLQAAVTARAFLFAGNYAIIETVWKNAPFRRPLREASMPPEADALCAEKGSALEE